MKKNLLRATWPKIREIKIKGQKLFQVDARKKGTNGKQESFSDREEAQERATAIAAEFAANGNEGLALPADLRFMAIKGDEILKPYGKSILQACEFYRDYLAELEASRAGETVDKLAREWHNYKFSGKQKKLRGDTLLGIRNAATELIKAFGNRPVTSITETDVRTYLDNLPVAPITKKGKRNLFGQFFNWAIEHNKGIKINPASKNIRYIEEAKEVAILTPVEAVTALRLCEKKYPQLTLFHAIGLFAGLRPAECKLLTWENVHLDERIIYVGFETSKVKESRRVPIEDNLVKWLEATPPEERKGLVVRKENFGNIVREMRAELGYKYKTERHGKALNPNGEKGGYIPDVLRHSYGSYWLAKNQNRAQLAENMGNSIDVIKKHYKRVVTKADTETFWEILPEVEQNRKKDKKKKIKSLFPKV